MTMDAVISTDDLTKFYGRHRGCEGVALHVQRGERFGFLGPNGAGKTTTIRLLLDLLRPTRGRATVLGRDPHEQDLDVRSRLGFAPAEVELYADMSGRHLLRALARLRPSRPPVLRDEVLDVVGLGDRDLRRKTGTYSTGMKRKLLLASALQHDPELVILDEPTSGLDPVVQRRLLEFLDDFASRGRTVFFSSHNLPEVDSICDRVGIVFDGRLVKQESIEALRAQAFRRVEVRLAPDSPAPDLSASGLTLVSHEERVYSIRVVGSFDPLVKALAACRVDDLTSEPPRLDDVFFSLAGSE